MPEPKPKPKPKPKPNKGKELTVEFTDEQLQTLTRLQQLTSKSRQAILREMVTIYSEDYEYLFHRHEGLNVEHVAELRQWRETGNAPAHPKPKQ